MEEDVRIASVSWIGALLFFAGKLWAQPLVKENPVAEERRAGAREAAVQGIAAYQHSRFDEAIDRLARAESLFHAPIHLLYLARSYRNIGRLVLAQEYYIKLTRETVPADAPKIVREAVDAAQKELAELKPQVPFITIAVEGNQGRPVQVTMDGEVVPPELIGIRQPVDPGVHQVEVSCYDFQPARGTLTLKAGQRETLQLRLIPVPVSANAPNRTTVGGVKPLPKQPMTSPSSKQPSDLVAYVALGVGAIGAGVGTFALSRRGESQRAANAEYTCYPSCTQIQKAEVDSRDLQAARWGTVSLVSFGLGLSGAATGALLLILNHRQTGSSSGSEFRGVQRPLLSSRNLSLFPQFGPLSMGVVGKFE